MKRKIYDQLLLWKNKRNGKSAMMIEGARRVGKSYIVKEFAKRQAYHATYGSQALPHHPLFATLIYFNGAHHHFEGRFMGIPGGSKFHIHGKRYF